MANDNSIPTEGANPAPKRRQRLDLPFIKRRRDAATVVYDHRAGIFSIVIFFLALAVAFVGSKIVVRTPEPAGGILVDLRTVEELRHEAERLAREVRMRQSTADEAYIRNAISNEGAELRDDRNTNTSDLQNRLHDATGRMNANRDAWDRGMRDIDAMGADRGGKTGNANGDVRTKGRVMVSFSLVDPTRYSDNLVTPGYRCERGGEVVVNITVGRSGDLLSASVERSLSDADACMHEAALDAARRSRFTPDASAPERHTGTITYTFIPQ